MLQPTRIVILYACEVGSIKVCEQQYSSTSVVSFVPYLTTSFSVSIPTVPGITIDGRDASDRRVTFAKRGRVPFWTRGES